MTEVVDQSEQRNTLGRLKSKKGKVSVKRCGKAMLGMFVMYIKN